MSTTMPIILDNACVHQTTLLCTEMLSLKKYILRMYVSLAFEIVDDECVDVDGSSMYIHTYVHVVEVL